MDFNELLQRATLNQVTVEKKLKRQKISKEESQRQLEIEEAESKRKVAAHLRIVKEIANKEKLKYKGVQSPMATKSDRYKVPLPSPITITTSKPHPRTDKNRKNHSLMKTDTKSNAVNTKTNSKTNAANTKVVSLTDTAKGTKTIKTKGKSKSRSSSPLTGHARSTPTGHAQNSPTGHARNSPTGHARNPQKPAITTTNYQDLMKLAELNSTKHIPKNHTPLIEVRSKGNHTPSSEVRCERNHTPSSEVRCKGQTSSKARDSPIGKSLVDRANQKARGTQCHNRNTPIPSATSATSATSNRTIEDRNPKDGVKVAGKDGVKVAGKNGVKVAGKDGVKSSSSSELTRRPLRKDPTNGVSPGKRRGQSKPAASATSFYGSATSHILKRDGKSHPYVGGRYTSTWVDEMSDYLEATPLCPEDMYDDDDDDLDGFVASDNECIDGGDGGDDGDGGYSAEIAKIFGYDRTKFKNEEDRYNVAMESSYAQQQFEETRSAHIGHIEDEEDLKRERQKMKRKKITSHKTTATKRTKHSF